MNIIIITQDDPFYLAENLDYLITNLPENATIVGCVVSNVSPFGKKETFLQKSIKTYNIFGLAFFLHYSWKFLLGKLDVRKKVVKVLERYSIPQIFITKSINSEVSLETLKSYKPDLLISIAGNEIFKKPLIDLAPHGCLNLHTALLPKYRGLMPSFWVLKNQEKYTGVSIFYVDEGIDSGPILTQKKIDIQGMSQEQLIKVTKKIGMDAIIESIKKIQGGDIATLSNCEDDMTYHHFPTRQDVIEFKNNGARFF